MAVAAKKVAAKKPVEVPEAVEVDFTYTRSTTGTHRWDEVGEKSDQIVGALYTRKHYFGDFVPTEDTVLTLTIQVK